MGLSELDLEMNLSLNKNKIKARQTYIWTIFIILKYDLI